MKKDLKQRPSAEELLKHPWIIDTPETKIDDELAKESLENLSSYSRHNKFQQGVVNYLTYTTSQKEEMRKLSEIFKVIDTNNDGKLDIEEITKYMKKVMGTCNFQEIKEIFDKIDTDQSGYIDYSEFLAATINKKKLLRKEELKQAFSHIDKDGSGDISKAELHKAFKTKGTLRTDQEWQEILNQIDLDGNEEINFEEFVATMEKVIHPEITPQAVPKVVKEEKQPEINNE